MSPQKPTYEELEQRVKELEKKSLEHKYVEKTLKFERDKLKSLIDGLASTNIGVDIVSADYEIIQQNQTLIDRFGDIAGKKCYKEYMVLEEPCRFCPMVKALKSKRLEKAEIRSADGRDYEILSAPLTDPDGMVNKAFEVVLDITDRKQIEKALKKNKAILKAVFDSLPFDVFALDSNNRYFLQNSICKKNWGDLIGKCPEDLPVNKKTLNLWMNNNCKAFSGETVADEVDYHSLEGKKYCYYNIIAPIRDEEKISGILGVLVDISELKQTEEALRESEERYKSLFKNNHSVMLLIDPENADIVDANPAAVSFYGWSYEELTCKKITNIDMFTEKKVFQEMEKAKKEQRRHFYFQNRLRSGEIRDVEVYSGPIKVYGRELLYSIIYDITKRKQAELSLIERRKELEIKSHELEEANAALKVLLKNRDEDKKDFENKIVANVKKIVFPYVEKLYSSQLNDRQIVYLDIIKSNLLDIISPFLHQLSSKYSDLTPSEIQIAELVKDGKTTKEIAELLNSSTDAIDFHRHNLRKKLGLRKTKTNLRSFLLSFT
jgi:PAS domain S-box-containing protein